MAAEPRTLVVMRHAKAEAHATSDAQRPLAPSGRRDAAAAGTWLAAQDTVPDHALVSAALRTRETWASLAGGAGWDLEPDVDEGLYSASVEAALDLVRRVPEGVGTVLVLGHNPTMASLAQLLDDGEGDPTAGDGMVQGFPTCALAAFTWSGSWADLALGSATLRDFHVARAT